jgi:hypothetical protein
MLGLRWNTVLSKSSAASRWSDLKRGKTLKNAEQRAAPQAPLADIDDVAEALATGAR